MFIPVNLFIYLFIISIVHKLSRRGHVLCSVLLPRKCTPLRASAFLRSCAVKIRQWAWSAYKQVAQALYYTHLYISLFPVDEFAVNFDYEY